MVTLFRQALGDLAGNMVLDVATGRGSSVGILQRNLNSYASIIGIDKDEKNIQSAQKARSQKDVRFIHMDAETLAFRDQSFDLVFMSNSLHHLADISKVLDAMTRVLKSGGKLVINETHRDGQTESQLTPVYVHHWIAQIDNSLGLVHNKTFSRQTILDYVQKLGLANITIYDRIMQNKNPFSKKTIHRYKKHYIDKFIARAQKAPDAQELARQGEALRNRLDQFGTQTQEPLVIIVGEK